MAAAATTKPPSASKHKFDFSPFINKYKEDVKYVDDRGNIELPVSIMYVILQEACSKWGYGYNIIVKECQVTTLFHKVIMRVEICSIDGDKTIRIAEGVSTKYAYDYAPLASKAASEIAETIATGRALSKLGINIDGRFSSHEEIEIFRSMKKDQATIDFPTRRAATLFARCQGDLKQKCKMKNIQIKDMLTIAEQSGDDVILFSTLLTNHIVKLSESEKL